jgi:hypothetical protein
MTQGAEPALHILEAKLADPETAVWDRRVLFGEGGIVPRLDVVFPEPDGVYSELVGVERAEEERRAPRR